MQTIPSLSRVVQVLAAHRQPNQGFAADDSAWPKWLDAFEREDPAMQPPSQLFDHWSRQGVLCLNLGLTFSRFDQDDSTQPTKTSIQDAHMRLWTPVVQRILSHLVSRPGKPVVLMRWGRKAQKAVDAMNLPACARVAGNADGLLEVSCHHPNARPEQDGAPPAFFDDPNPFTQANELLKRVKSEPPINW